MPGLSAIAAALNAGDMARAIFATQFMRLPELTEAQAGRAIGAEALLRKAAADDEKRPGWPAGTPDSKGGEFRPKNGSDSGGGNPEETMEPKTIEDATRRRIARKAFRLGVAKILNARRIARLLVAEGLDTLSGASEMFEMNELASAVEAFETLTKDVKATTNFLEKAPYGLDEIQLSTEEIKFSSMDAFVKIEIEKRFGPAGEGYEYHHIVEQGGSNASASFRGDLNSTKNIVKIPKLIHELITSQYASSAARGRASLRSQIRSWPFEKQYEFGRNSMRDLGITC